MGRTAHHTRLALGRSAFEPATSPSNSVDHNNPAGTSSRAVRVSNHVQLYDKKGYAQSPETRLSNRHWRLAVNDVLATVGICVQGESSSSARPPHGYLDGAKIQRVVLENDIGIFLNAGDWALWLLTTYWHLRLRQRLQTFSQLSCRALLKAEWSNFGSIQLLSAGATSRLAFFGVATGITYLSRFIVASVKAVTNPYLQPDGWGRQIRDQGLWGFYQVLDLGLLSLAIPLEIYATVQRLALTPTRPLVPWSNSDSQGLHSISMETWSPRNLGSLIGYISTRLRPTAYLWSTRALKHVIQRKLNQYVWAAMPKPTFPDEWSLRGADEDKLDQRTIAGLVPQGSELTSGTTFLGQLACDLQSIGYAWQVFHDKYLGVFGKGKGASGPTYTGLPLLCGGGGGESHPVPHPRNTTATITSQLETVAEPQNDEPQGETNALPTTSRLSVSVQSPLPSLIAPNASHATPDISQAPDALGPETTLDLSQHHLSSGGPESHLMTSVEDGDSGEQRLQNLEHGLALSDSFGEALQDRHPTLPEAVNSTTQYFETPSQTITGSHDSTNITSPSFSSEAHSSDSHSQVTSRPVSPNTIELSIANDGDGTIRVNIAMPISRQRNAIDFTNDPVVSRSRTRSNSPSPEPRPSGSSDVAATADRLTDICDTRTSPLPVGPQHHVTALLAHPAESAAQKISAILADIIFLPFEAYFVRSVAHAFLASSPLGSRTPGWRDQIYRPGAWFGVGLRNAGWRGIGDYVGRMALVQGLEALTAYGTWQVGMGLMWYIGSKWCGWAEIQ